MYERLARCCSFMSNIWMHARVCDRSEPVCPETTASEEQ